MSRDASLDPAEILYGSLASKTVGRGPSIEQVEVKDFGEGKEVTTYFTDVPIGTYREALEGGLLDREDGPAVIIELDAEIVRQDWYRIGKRHVRTGQR